MNSPIPAIYAAGVFRPLVPVELADGTHVEMDITTAPSWPPVSAANQQKAWQTFLEQVESLPNSLPADGLTNRDHDRILYGS